MTLNKYPPHQLHKPVLLQQVMALLKPVKDENYLDLTAGFGGHASEVLRITGNGNNVTLVDRDQEAISALDSFKNRGALIIHDDFYHAVLRMRNESKTFDMILLDLGVSSPQLDNPERGFSFSQDGKLDMRMDMSQEETALDIVNGWSEDKIIRTIQNYGEDPFARTIAKAIIRSRPHESSKRLADVIAKTVRGRVGNSKSRVHPATRTFQALRIAVNDELGQLERTLIILPELLKTGGRLAVISFHSLEDRIVKKFLQEESNSGYESRLTLLTKNPMSGSEYDASNPRARSAKLRAAVKIKT